MNKKIFSQFLPHERNIFKKLSTPVEIQDFLNTLKINFEKQGDTCMPPRLVLKNRMAHCVEGAIFAALALRVHGFPPLLVDTEATEDDYDHVIAVFRIRGYWGAIGKTNHAVLRYREPVYRDIRELVMSFFHEYFLNSTRKKTLRAYTEPIDLRRFDKRGWMTTDKSIWYIADYLAEARHKKILQRWQISRLRKADPIELEAGKLIEYKE